MVRTQPLHAESVVFSFGSDGSAGSQPLAGLIGDGGGNFYGTTYDGGGHGCSFIGFDGCGAVFELSRVASGYVTSFLYSFKGGNDGAHPLAPLWRAADGALFGTTSRGGVRSHGVVFKLTPAGSGYEESVIYRFLGGKDGSHPCAGVVASSDGTFYGTTRGGGIHNYGTIFSLSPTPSGYTKRTIHEFTASDGYFPESTLTMGQDGALYGTTFGGWGNVFRLTRSRSTYQLRVLYSFRDRPDGANPLAGVTIGARGALFGTTERGGRHGFGTVFKLTPHGTTYEESIIWDFNGINGGVPASGILLDRGLLFGTTQIGGGGHGVVFRLRPMSGGTYTEDLLHVFSGQPDGDEPVAPPTIYGTTLLGTTMQGGSYTGGTIFSVDL
jgi:uncharacterized repeat protein (TIGR03803 family)